RAPDEAAHASSRERSDPRGACRRSNDAAWRSRLESSHRSHAGRRDRGRRSPYALLPAQALTLTPPGTSFGHKRLSDGCAAGSDAFIAARHVSRSGRVIGIDMTDAQLEKARTLARAHDYPQVDFRAGLIEEVPLPDGEVDCVISNGVINLAPDKTKVFAEAAR